MEDKIIDFNYYRKTLTRLSGLLFEEEDKDVTFTFKGSKKSIKAHKLILKAVSPVFKAMFSGNFTEMDKVKIEDIKPKVFQLLLDGIYLTEIKFEGSTLEHQLKTARDLMYAAEKYDIQDVRLISENFIKDNTPSKYNVCRLLQTAVTYELPHRKTMQDCTTMTSIDSLFDWLLEPIFLNLPLHDRLVCKLVCQRWYRILMKSQKFRNDRHIYLRKCVIDVNQGPASIFMNAMFPYEILTIGYSVKSESQDDLNQFAQHLGDSVTEVEINGCSGALDLFWIINKLPKLKSLTVGHSLRTLAKTLKKIRQNESGLLNIDVLKINTDSEEPLEPYLKMIKRRVKENTEIVLNVFRVCLRENDSLENILPVLNVAKIGSLAIYVAERPNQEMEQLLQMNKLCCDIIEFDFPPTQAPYSYLETFSNAHPNVKEFTLACNTLPPNIELQRLTELSLGLQMPVQSLKSLENLINLKKLTLYESDHGCAFGHDPVNLASLTELDAFYTLRTNWSCPECFEALVQSFDNLTWFDGYSISSSEMWLLLHHWKFMKEIWVACATIDFEKNLIEPRAALETLFLITDEIILTVDGMTKLVETYPNLREITFNAHHSVSFVPSFQNIIKIAVSELKHLEKFEFYCRLGIQIPLGDIKLVLKHLKSCGFTVSDSPKLKKAQIDNIKQIELYINHENAVGGVDVNSGR